ncbi:MAG: Ycf48-like protein [Saprospiraceae bacterium]|nr:Ycf48-like protein [Saprospiraceae bacterium]
MKRELLLLAGVLSLMIRLSAQDSGYWMRVSGPYGGTFRNITRTDSGALYVLPNQPFGFGPAINWGARLYRSDDNGQHWSKLALTINGQPFNSYISVGPSGRLYTLTYNNNIANTNLYRSDDGGASWTLLADSTDLKQLNETPDGALVACAGNHLEIRRSTDGGQTWETVFTAPASFYSDLQIMPNGDMVWFGGNDSQNQTIYHHSTDDGQSWTTVTMPGYNNYPLFIAPGGTFLAKGGSGILRSVDNGQTWQEITVDGYIDLSSFAALPSGRILSAASSQNGLYFSDDDGLTWTKQPTEQAIYQILPVTASDGSVLGYANESLYRSTDGGANWEFGANGMDLAQVLQMAFASPDTFLALTLNGLWRTDNNGQQWTQLTYQPANAYKNGLAFNETGEFVLISGFSLLWSDDLGDHFTDITPPAEILHQFVRYRAADSLIFIDTQQGVMRSTDNGQSWQSIFPGQSLIFHDLLFHPSGRIFAYYLPSLNETTFLYSDDRGDSWTPVAGEWDDILEIREMFANRDGEIYVFATDSTGTILRRSLDNGLSWSSHPELAATGLYPAPFAENIAEHLFVLNNQTISRSLDKGVTWSKIPNPIVTFPGGGSFKRILDPISTDQYMYIGTSSCGLLRTRNPTSQGAYLSGRVRHDADSDCSTPDAQTALHNWVVNATGNNSYYTTTDSAGRYLMFVDTGAYEIRAEVPNGVWWDICEDPQYVILDSLLGLDTFDFSAVALSECPLMTVDLSMPTLRRCFDNSVFLNYCNQGAETAIDARVDVMLDPFLALITASLPAIDMGNNTYRFDLGDIPPGGCGQFRLTVHVNCDSTVLGQTHCIAAHGYPDTLCAPVPDWSGATIQAGITCQDTVLQMTLKNTGTAPSQQLDYIIIVDDVVLMQGNQSYDPGQEIVMTQPADGHTWRIESQQEPGHPFATNNHIALAFAEGCGGFESLGFINQFAVDQFTPSWDRDCQENTGSYDPNDKQGFPLGYGDEHYIRPGQELEYLIRFQNTGTDTAFNVVITDTLSPWLDPASVRPGAASHPYTWELSGQGVLRFTFADILLTDSNTNLAGSQGFVSFRINQQPDVPLQTQIFNSAAIYFDFNPPVITNQTMHTIGEDYLVGTNAPVHPAQPSRIFVSPNPASESAIFQLKEGFFDHHHITVTDAYGRKVRESNASGKQFLFQRNGLPPGAYFFRVEDAKGKWLGSGKLILR